MDRVVRYLPLPEGRPGELLTLQEMRRLIRGAAAEPLVRAFLEGVQTDPGLEALSETALVEVLFDWIRARVLEYPDDHEGGRVQDEVRSPGVMLDEIARFGRALGDCDDFVVLLGALYHGLGLPVEIVAVSQSPDRMLDHVYLRVQVDGEWIAADLIVPEPVGWEIPEAEITDEVVVPV